MLDLIMSAVQAIMQVMVIVLVGSILYSRGYIDNEKQKWLSKLNLFFFTPCLLFSNIASVISFEKLLAYWPIPVFYCVFTLISWLLCQTVMPMFGVDKYYKRFILACVMFCNTNSLPVAIISSLAVSEAGKTLYWGSDDNQDMVSARGISYTLFFGLFCNILRWSYGYNLLQRKDEDDDTIVEDDVSTHSSSYGSLNDTSRRSSSATMSDRRNEDVEANKANASTLKEPHETATLLDQRQSKPQSQLQPSPWMQCLKSIDKYMSPPLYAALLALFVGLCPPIKHLMYNTDSFFYASLTKAIESCGKASVPIVLVCLGAQLKSIRETQHESSPKYRQPVSLSIFIRMVLTPLCVLPLVYAFAKYGSKWSELANDPMFIVSMIVVGCTPTAINLAQITQVSGIFEEEMLNVLFWSYGVICIPVCTFVVFLALYMVKSMH
ncbi:Translocon-associated protein subunit alpha (Signal sequence receptor subunit alpha) [Mucor velutinosus]|uniref:Translocon-associated protein subunit alpha (Signal sequence receptor subunit alpha) n=1 Tax=Mucor velutinosus TaxID=708070 RepID=A0AAN7DTV0_9FUNG|nr:Translocon-associated protein subunit alpha (Signal sequence receptor subunit alpha) [Mucor velutinosus]